MDRREFSGISAAVGAGLIAAPAVLKGQGAKGKTLKIGLIGCGGRGTGAATQALNADENVKLWAVADAFDGQMKSALKRVEGFGDKVEVTKERQFGGVDGFKKLIDSGVDVVLLGTPPSFRPQHLRAAVEAGKHVFAEKPMAVDMTGVKSVMESAKLAAEKNVSIQHGYCWRFAPAVRAMFEKIHAGDFGRLTGVYGTYLASPPKVIMPASARKEGWADVEWQLRNWINFDHFSGGPLLEQAVHTVDKVAWAMNDVAPVAAVASGGLIRDRDGGNIYDHYNVAYEYPDGVFAHVGQRQYRSAHNEVIDRVFCEKGMVVGPGRPTAFDKDKKRIWSYRGKNANMYQVCHNEFFSAIRAGKIINTGEYMANSTALGLLGREAAHSGKRITWDQLWKSDQDLAPDDLKLNDSFTAAPLPQPTKYKFG